MEKSRVGHTGLYAAPIGLGTMTWGRDTDEHEAKEQLTLLLNNGGNVVDTSPTYGDGKAEELLGTLLDTDFNREDLILVTKGGVSTSSTGQHLIDTSRSTLLSNLDASLERLGTAYIDVWLVHRFDPRTRWRETLSALLMALRSGRARYVGVSNYPGWALARLATALEAEGYELAVAENEYSLLERGCEREVIPAAIACGAGFFASSPAGRGVLTGKYRSTIPPDSRAASTHLGSFVQPYLDKCFHGIVESVCAASDGLERQPVEVALAWVASQHHVSCALSGARSAQQFRTILEGDSLTLPHQIASALTDVSAPIIGYPEDTAFV
ncbi:MAG: aldo/keto reductase [Actinomycetaceae bacterium]|nr:aldo/keto reductase [Actinomycetaceae bacterium]